MSDCNCGTSNPNNHGMLCNLTTKHELIAYCTGLLSNQREDRAEIERLRAVLELAMKRFLPGDLIENIDALMLSEHVALERAEAAEAKVEMLLNQNQEIASSNADNVEWHREMEAKLAEAQEMASINHYGCEQALKQMEDATALVKIQQAELAAADKRAEAQGEAHATLLDELAAAKASE